MRPIYLDYNATTPVDPAITEVIHHALRELWGNPSSTHEYGLAAHNAIEVARQQLAALIGAEPDEIVFTGGGSEASNLAIKGVLMPGPRAWYEGKPYRFLGINWRWQKYAWVPGRFTAIISAIEHPATANPVDYLQRMGVRTHVIPVDRHGLTDPEDVRKKIRWGTGHGSDTLVSIMHSNNEVGTLMPIAEIGKICREQGVLFHTDCAQSLGKVPVNVKELKVDLMTIAGHKVYAPKGVGALYVRRGVNLEPLIHGAGHEAGRRAGTENVPYIVGLGKAAEIARESLPATTVKLRALRDRLHEALKAKLGDRVVLNGHPEKRLPNTLNVNFVGHRGGELLKKVPRIAASTGSACHEKGKESQSPVLCAMGVDPAIGIGAVRLTVGRWTTEAEIDEAAELLIRASGE